MANKMAVVVSTNEIDKLISVFNMALGGASMGMDVTLFFSFHGLELLKKDKSGDSYQKPNPSLERMMAHPKFPSIDQMVLMCKELGVKFIACTQSMEFMGLTKEDLLPVVDQVAGVATFLADAEDSKINFLV
jgi:peroxiredoxin family protein